MALALSVSDLRVVAAGGRTLLDIPALDLPPGAALGIRGPSGAGKTTFLHAVAGLIDRSAGRIAWGDTDLAALSAGARARFRAGNVGMIFQDFLLFDELTALDNAAIPALFAPRGRRAGLREAARANLARLGLTDPVRDVSTFSGGERQRVSVARALANRPAIVLADEPTAALHREAADRLIADLVSVARDGNRTLVAVSHDPRLLDAMDRVLTIEDGRPAERQAA
ncbi:putative ABC transport system ATP-binding protein [Tranquillimonas rosea]|uniref:Putative ABC transport system ATP-binding protein n=1 Tax=Tranquillimonas rosea TaxID=641238 RepID=A0A1H9W280_9RHOB|nr:ATP-binding cassette domain-containing protein [Tranquillimonas rosea]SES27889.1 putative ABC transport system ATP-binding protein [Tranquillimonas rosea]